MRIDTRGGHNRYFLDRDFFKKWTAPMAYVLGYTFADGTIINANKTSRTCYLRIDSNDREILVKIKKCLNSLHIISKTPPQKKVFFGKTYLVKAKFSLRIGSKAIYNDLTQLGLVPNKSLVMNFPKMPNYYFKFF